MMFFSHLGDFEVNHVKINRGVHSLKKGTLSFREGSIICFFSVLGVWALLVFV